MFELHYVIYLVLIGAGFLVGLINHRKNRKLLSVVILLGVTFASEFIANILAHTIRNNIVVYHFFHPIEATLWGCFFYMNMHTGLKKYVTPLWVCLIIFGILNFFMLQGVHAFQTNFVKFEFVVLLFWAFCLFLEFLDYRASENIFANSSFIICVGVIWYNLVSYLFFDLFDFFAASPRIAISVHRVIHYFSNFTFYGLLLFSMFLKKSGIYE